MPPRKKSPADVQMLIDLAKAQGLKRLKVDGVEFEFADAAPTVPTRSATAAPRRIPTGEDFLFWSTGERLSFEPVELTAAARAAMPDAGPGKGK